MLSCPVKKILHPVAYYMRYSEGLEMTGFFDMASGLSQEETRSDQASHIIYITEKPVRQHHLSMRRARPFGYWLACSV